MVVVVQLVVVVVDYAVGDAEHVIVRVSGPGQRIIVLRHHVDRHKVAVVQIHRPVVLLPGHNQGRFIQQIGNSVFLASYESVLF